MLNEGIPYQRQLTLSRLAISTRGRRLNDHRLAGVDGGVVASFELFHPAILAARPVLANLARFAAGKAKRPHAAMARQNRAFHFFEKADGAANAAAGMPLPLPPEP